MTLPLTQKDKQIQWIEEQIMEKLNNGWVLDGDCGSEVPFGFFGPERVGYDSAPTIPASLVRTLFEKGILGPCTPGRKISYLSTHSETACSFVLSPKGLGV